MNKRASRSGKNVGGKAIGTWVRIPGPPKIIIPFFLMCSYADSKVVSTMCFRSQHAKWPLSQIPWPRWKDYHGPWSTHA